MSSEALYLRAAAKRLRELAADATPGPWTLYDRGVCWEINELDAHDGTSLRRGDAHYIAALNPLIAEPLAKWLESEADTYEEWPSSDNYPCRESVPVAYAILAARPITEETDRG